MVSTLVRRIAGYLGSALIGALIVGFVLLVRYLVSGPPLAWWQTMELADEYTAERAASVHTIADYRALEGRLHAAIAARRAAEPVADQSPVQRYVAGSRSDPGQWPEGDWNRTQEFIPPEPRGAALLLHGLSDSPYSMRALATLLSASNIAVVVLRLPGHGTLPAGLRTYRVEDMRAAVRLAARDLSARVGANKPLWLVGYSNGATLAVDYALDVVDGARLPAPTGLVLFSPAIGIAPAARIVALRHVFGWLPGLGKLSWSEISPEYDPFKYSSFTFNAIEQTSALTRSIQRHTQALEAAGRLDAFPPTLAFLSTVDATVRADAVVDQFLGRLKPNGHALVLFDVNRRAQASEMLKADVGPLTERLLATEALPFELAVVTNRDGANQAVDALVRRPGAALERTALCLSWPPGVFSLSHLALPFAPDDLLYGDHAAPDPRVIQLGHIEARGETGVLALPRWLTTRQRSNPFFSYVEERVRRFVGDPAPVAARCAGPAS